MKTVTKKILPKYFELVENQVKNFEIRNDEDGIQIGDILVLKEWNGFYTGRGVSRSVKYILRDAPEFGLVHGFCIIGW